MKVTYTASAQEQLQEFAEQQKRHLEKLIVDRKSVPGDDLVEVTASDIKEAAKLVRPMRRAARATSIGRSLSAIYVIVGATMAVAALYYDQLKSLLQQSPQQASLLLAGVSLALTGFVSYVFFRSRERRYRELSESHQSIPQDETDRAESRLLLPPDQFVYSILSDFLSRFPAFQRRRFVLEVRDGEVDLTAFNQSMDGKPQHFKYRFNREPGARITEEVSRLRVQILRDLLQQKLDAPHPGATSNQA